MSDYDVVVIGSGLGGLCCGSILSLSGLKVLVCEKHSKPGGVAHSFSKKGYTFESGPSLWNGINNQQIDNPLGHILRLLNEEVKVAIYKDWEVIFPDARFRLEVGKLPFRKKIKELRGENALEEWEAFLADVKPISDLVKKLPLLTSSPLNLNLIDSLKIAGKLLPDLKQISKLRKGFGYIADKNLNDQFLRNWVDLLSFLISGMPMHDTNTAAMATLFNEWFNPQSYLEYPLGGSESIVNALISGLQKNGGELLCSSNVKEVIFKNKIAYGVKLDNGREFKAKFVVMNCDTWNINKLIPSKICTNWQKKTKSIPSCSSFLHIHLGFDATNLNDLPIHTIWVDNWERGITADRNVAVFSIPSVLDSSMAPKNKHVLHGYTPANEPWEIWKNIDPKSKRYRHLKEERCSIFIKALKNIIPDIEKRIEVKMLGTPLTHNFFTNTEYGSYGPAISASETLFPGCKTPIKNLFTCGASTFPGIGVPAVAASGAYAAEAILGKKEYRRLFK